MALRQLQRVIGDEDDALDFIVDGELLAAENELFRRVVWTAKEAQLALMTMPPGTDTGSEQHDDTTQFIVLVAGAAIYEREGRLPRTLRAGHAVFVERGVRHNVRAIGPVPLRLYTLYQVRWPRGPLCLRQRVGD